MKVRLIVMNPVIYIKLHDAVDADVVEFRILIVVKQNIIFIDTADFHVVLHPHFPNLPKAKANVWSLREKYKKSFQLDSTE